MKKYITITRLLLLNELRNREAMIFSLLLPIAILVLIGESDKSQIPYIYPGVICIAFGSIALIGVASQVTSLRENGILKRVKLTELSLNKFIYCIYISQIFFMLGQLIIITLIAIFVYDLKFKIDKQFLFGVAIQTVLGMLSLIAIGILIATFSKNTRAASTIGNTVIVTMLFVGNTLFPSNGWPKAIKQVVKYFPMNNLGDSLRRTLIYNSQSMEHFVFQTLCLLSCFVLFYAIGQYLLNKTVTSN